MKTKLAKLLALVILVAMLVPGALAEDIEIRMGWWGGNTRNNYMNEMLDLYESQHPGITVTREYTAWNDYWTKYATQAATGSSPDVVEHTMMTLAEYANKGVVQPLDAFVADGSINLADFSSAAIAAGNYDEKQYMILFGMTASAIYYNKTLLEQYGCELPPQEWTMSEMHEYMKNVRAKVPEDVALFIQDAGYDHTFETYCRSLGKSVFTKDGKGLGIEKQDMINYFQYWEDLRADGIVADPIAVAESFSLPQEQSYICTGKALFTVDNSNILQTYAHNEAGYDIRLTGHPTVDGDNGAFLQPTGFCISSTADPKVADAAADLINWLVNDVDGNKLFHEDLGMPGSNVVAEALNEEAIQPIKVFHEYMQTSVLPTARGVDFRPEGASEVMSTMKLMYQEVGSGEKDIATAVDEFFAEAETILNK